jgi:hypothetical protein
LRLRDDEFCQGEWVAPFPFRADFACDRICIVCFGATARVIYRDWPRVAWQVELKEASRLDRSAISRKARRLPESAQALEMEALAVKSYLDVGSECVGSAPGDRSSSDHNTRAKKQV